MANDSGWHANAGMQIDFVRDSGVKVEPGSAGRGVLWDGCLGVNFQYLYLHDALLCALRLRMTLRRLAAARWSAFTELVPLRYLPRPDDFDSFPDTAGRFPNLRAARSVMARLTLRFNII